MIELHKLSDQPSDETKRKRRISQIPDTQINYFLKSKESFRSKLLQNLETFRTSKLTPFKPKSYRNPSQSSVYSVHSSRIPSSLSQFSQEDFTYLSKKKSKKRQKNQAIEKSLKDSLALEKQSYQTDLISRLKSTLPKYLESPRKKALRTIS